MKSSRKSWQDWEDTILRKSFPSGFRVEAARRIQYKLPGRSFSGMENRLAILNKLKGKKPKPKQERQELTATQLDVIRAVAASRPELGNGTALMRHLYQNELTGCDFDVVRRAVKRLKLPKSEGQGKWEPYEDGALLEWLIETPDAKGTEYWAAIAQAQVSEIAARSISSIRNRIKLWLDDSDETEAISPVPEKFANALPKTLTPGQREIALSIATYDRPSAKRYAAFCVENEKLLPQVA